MYDAWTDDNVAEYDWAIIELNSNIGDNVGWLGLRYQGSSYNGTISSSYTRLLRSTNTNLIGGMSGGPVYIYSSSSGYTAIAIATSGVTTLSGSKYNRFVRITQDVYNDLVEYRSIRV